MRDADVDLDKVFASFHVESLDVYYMRQDAKPSPATITLFFLQRQNEAVRDFGLGLIVFRGLKSIPGINKQLKDLRYKAVWEEFLAQVFCIPFNSHLLNSPLPW